MKKILSFLLSFLMITAPCAYSVSAASGTITSLKTPPVKLWGLTENTIINAPKAVASATNVSGVSLTPVWSGADGFSFGTKVEGGKVIAYTATYTAPDGYVFSENFENGENVTVSEDGKTLTYKLYSYVIPTNAIYISDKGSNSADDYAEGNYSKPYKTIDYAMSQLDAKGGGTIVITDSVVEAASTSQTRFSSDFTVVGWDENSSLTFEENYYLRGNMTFRDLNIITKTAWSGIYANGYNLTLGDKSYSDLKVSGNANSRMIYLAADGTSFSKLGKLTINSGSWGYVVGAGYHASRIYTDMNYEINGGEITNFTAGFSANENNKDDTLNGNINITINGGNITNLSLTSSGARFTHTGNVYYTQNGGTVGNVSITSENSAVVDDKIYSPRLVGDVYVKINGGKSGPIMSPAPDNITGTASIDILDYDGNVAVLDNNINKKGFDVVRSTVLYVDSKNGKASNSGTSPESALDNLTNALAIFEHGDSGKIIILGDYDTTKGFTDKSGRGEAIISSAPGGKLIVSGKISLLGDTTFKNLEISSTSDSHTIFTGMNKFTAEETVKMTGSNAVSIECAAGSDVTISGGIYSAVKLYNSSSDETALTINGGTFKDKVTLGSSSLTVINGGTFSSDIEFGSTTSDISGNVIAEVNGGTFNGKFLRNSGKISGKSVLITNNDTEISVADSSKFDFVVLSSGKGVTTYNATRKKFSLKPEYSTMNLIINGTTKEKTSAGLYTLSKGANNLYTIKYDGQAKLNTNFVISQPIADLTPASSITNVGGASNFSAAANGSISGVSWEPADEKFKFDTKYTAAVTVTAYSGLKYTDDFGGVVVNGGNSANKVRCELSEDKKSVTIFVEFPATEKKTFVISENAASGVTVKFTTARSAFALGNLNDTTITFEDTTGKSEPVTVKATETKNIGVCTANIKSGTYNVSIKKNGYLGKKQKSVKISSDATTLIDFGALVPGNVLGTGIIDADDFNAVLEAFKDGASEAVKNAANITEGEVPSVVDLGYIKSAILAGTTAESTNDAKVTSQASGAGIKLTDRKFENTYYRLTVDKKLTIGYIGGSIIQGGGKEEAGNDGFIDRLHGYFEKTFPEAEIHSINAGISNTGANFGLFRLSQDLMLRDEGYVPDLVFVEFSVNDWGLHGDENIKMILESLFYNVYKINPKADIVCLLTGLTDPRQQVGALHKEVADHYGITTINLGKEMWDLYKEAGDCKVFTNDNLHPNNAGYELYTKLIKEELEKYIVLAPPEKATYTDKKLPEQMYENIFDNPAVIPVTDESVTKEGTWSRVSFTSSNYRSRVFSENITATGLQSTAKGDTITFTFEGNAFGFYTYMSPTMGTFEYSVDGGEWIECNYALMSTYHPMPFMPGTSTSTLYEKDGKKYGGCGFTGSKTLLGSQLSDGKHTVTVRVTGNQGFNSSGVTTGGTAVGIIALFYNATK